MRTPAPLVLALATMLLVAGTAQASIATIGTVEDGASELVVADGTRDGKREVFVSDHGSVKMFKWSGSSWVKSSLGSLDTSSLAVGDGDRDGKVEVYAGGADGGLRRFAWTGSSWNRVKIATFSTGETGLGVSHVVLGDGENDGLREIYASAGDGDLYKVWFKDAAWHKQKIAELPVLTELRLGDGDRDGKAEFYTGTTSGVVLQVKRSSGTWKVAEVGTVTPGFFADGLAIGDGKHADQNELYVSDGNKQVFRFVWDAEDRNWFKQAIGFTDFATTELDTADLDGDDRAELYSGTNAGRFYRFKWTGSNWQRTLVGTGSGVTHGLDVGDGDNNGVREVYAVTSGDSVYRIT